VLVSGGGGVVVVVGGGGDGDGDGFGVGFGVGFGGCDVGVAAGGGEDATWVEVTTGAALRVTRTTTGRAA
jgi:hypothetical protein